MVTAPDPREDGMSSDTKWIIGTVIGTGLTIVTTVLTVAGLLFAQFGGLNDRIDDVNTRIDGVNNDVTCGATRASTTCAPSCGASAPR